jgi:hypothetical protein
VVDQLEQVVMPDAVSALAPHVDADPDVDDGCVRARDDVAVDGPACEPTANTATKNATRAAPLHFRTCESSEFFGFLMTSPPCSPELQLVCLRENRAAAP